MTLLGIRNIIGNLIVFFLVFFVFIFRFKSIDREKINKIAYMIFNMLENSENIHYFYSNRINFALIYLHY